jgi:hypothetical protein
MDKEDDSLVPVTLPSGAKHAVFKREATYLKERVERYQKDLSFTNVADLQTLDNVVVYETLLWRWGQWLSRQVDYWGEAIDEKELTRQSKDTSTEVRQLKSALGIDKVTRDKVKGEDSVANYIQNLLVRAKAFGINREKMLDKGLELSQELIAKLTLFDNCEEDERAELNMNAEDLVAWIRDVYAPEFQKVDEHFRENDQAMWVRSQ